MTTNTTNERWTSAEFPVLQALDLSDEERRALSRQGFVHREQRGAKTVFRLRFRVDRRQCVRYVSPRDAHALEAEVAQLQRTVRARRRLSALAAFARKALHNRRHHQSH